ncbi:hypothetical protein Poli38472_013412 [Pythium oligandrum]|uniref:Uncharacterized protein n=1 Tax=Pythium oligandrum TaxID=41045 RepID=A0A8K1C823_PYTOL|nr:hypothetical protein Poli38472_013412 [Pythium oligandrum]|eukprot:TMW57938.1 hypothetical protein Poli38472_013412 [Pythium oligandrum]
MEMLLSSRHGAAPDVTDSEFEAAADCIICDKKFHAFRRKHRCRSCGNAVCGSCARTHKIMPTSTLMRYSNEPVRVCDRCIRGQTQMMYERRRAEDIERARARQQAVMEEEERARREEQMRQDQLLAEELAREESRRLLHQRALELKHLGPRPDRGTIKRTRSLDDGAYVAVPYRKEMHLFIHDAEARAVNLLDNKPYATEAVGTATPTVMAVQQAAMAPEAEECAICLDTMEVGNAIYTTACGHSFHFQCLKAIQSSDSSNYDKCPSCRAVMTEMQVKKQCDHPRVRAGHRFCRDCGSSVSDREARPRPGDAQTSPMGPPPQQQPTSYRAGAHGALVRCPQCQIQMRVLPHMYNMRVACPSGHMFLVQVAGQMPGMGGMGGGSMSTSGIGMGSRSSSMGLRGRLQQRGSHSAYPGAAYYRAPNAYSEL